MIEVIGIPMIAMTSRWVTQIERSPLPRDATRLLCTSRLGQTRVRCVGQSSSLLLAALCNLREDPLCDVLFARECELVRTRLVAVATSTRDGYAPHTTPSTRTHICSSAPSSRTYTCGHIVLSTSRHVPPPVRRAHLFSCRAISIEVLRGPSSSAQPHPLRPGVLRYLTIRMQPAMCPFPELRFWGKRKFVLSVGTFRMFTASYQFPTSREAPGSTTSSWDLVSRTAPRRLTVWSAALRYLGISAYIVYSCAPRLYM